MTDHSCAMGMPSQVSATAQREVNAAPPLGHTDQQVRERTDLDALSSKIPRILNRRGQVGTSPTSPQLSAVG
jgi:hypothetical protein